MDNTPMRIVNALVNSIQRMITAAAATRGGTRDIDHGSHFQLWGLPTNELK